ncbi:hypothetical protein Taro_042913, partial [Colocasia esculenta]|nr:hypothetical protein [Colocasia esculenta]
MGERMGSCHVENLLAILFTVFAVSFASTAEYDQERAAKEGWLRSEQEMKWLYEEWVFLAAEYISFITSYQQKSGRAFAAVAAIEGLNKIVTVNNCYPLRRVANQGIFTLPTTTEVLTPTGIILTPEFRACADIRAVGISSYQKVPSYNEYALRRAVANQPVSVLIEAQGRAFRFHRSGVFTGECGTSTDHFLTLRTGWSWHDTTQFWWSRQVRNINPVGISSHALQGHCRTLMAKATEPVHEHAYG